MPFRFPTTSQRTTIIGRTGSGKTQFAVWLLSYQEINRIPFIIFEFKHDEDNLIYRIPYSKRITLSSPIPHEPGIYIVSPDIGQEELLEQFLNNIHGRGNVGIYIDEGYEIPRNSMAFNRILRQGRSLNIPVITLIQRPAQVSRYILSEADFFSIFFLTDSEDIKKIQRFIRNDAVANDISEYNSKWYDVTKNNLIMLTPVPDSDTILSRYEVLLKPRIDPESSNPNIKPTGRFI
jgi:DNA helicase HerA-like ATPase